MLEPDPPIARCGLIVLCTLAMLTSASNVFAGEIGRWESASNTVADGTSPLRNRLSFTGRYRFVTPGQDAETAAPDLANNAAAPTGEKTSLMVTRPTQALKIEPAVAVIGEPPAAHGATRAVIIDPPMTGPGGSSEPASNAEPPRSFETGKSASLTADPTPESAPPQLRDGIAETDMNATNNADARDEKAPTASASTSDTSSAARAQSTTARLKSSDRSSLNRAIERMNNQRSASRRLSKASDAQTSRARQPHRSQRATNTRTPSVRRPEQGADAKALVGPRWARNALFAE